jgi:hypothetical protein
MEIVDPDQQLDSYRVNLDVTYFGGNEEGEVLMVEEVTTNPPAHRVSMQTEGGLVETVQIGDQVWSCFDGNCSMSTVSDDVMADNFLFDQSEIESAFDDQEVVYLGQETVNGISTKHYELLIAFDDLDITDNGEVTDINSEVWVADEGDLTGVVVRFVMSWSGTEDGQPARGEYTMDVYDINEPFTIEPPDVETGLPPDFPQYPGTFDVGSFGNLVTFSAPDDPETVAGFYVTELTAQGWNSVSNSNMSGMFTQEWSNGDVSLTLTIIAADTGSTVTVVIEGP